MRLLLATTALALGACTSGPVTSQPPPSTTGWTVEDVVLPASTDAQVELDAVRAARHADHDRVAFQFDAGRPAVHVAYVDRPVRACGSGEAIYPPGDAWLEVRFTGARAHTEQGQPTAAPPRRELGLPNALALVQTCDFEGEVTWVVALASPEPFRVISLDGPARVAVDVRHR